MFISAGAGHKAFQTSDLPLNKAGFVKINDYCQVDDMKRFLPLEDFLGYQQHLSILCVMDSGNAAAYVQRGNTKETMLLLHVLGHWLKKGWGVYYKLSKMNKIPRLPGM